MELDAEHQKFDSFFKQFESILEPMRPPPQSQTYELTDRFWIVRLALAMFEDAVTWSVVRPHTDEGRRWHQWIYALDGYSQEDRPFSFDTICWLMRQDPGHMRKLIKNLKPEQLRNRGGRGRRGRPAEIGGSCGFERS